MFPTKTPVTQELLPKTNELTGLLQAWSGGDQQALEKLAPKVQKELHRIADRYMARERANHPLQATALINEAYIRLINWKDVRWQNRAHFFGVSAGLMRRILVDFARARGQAKHGKGIAETSLDEAFVLQPGKSFITHWLLFRRQRVANYQIADRLRVCRSWIPFRAHGLERRRERELQVRNTQRVRSTFARKNPGSGAPSAL